MAVFLTPTHIICANAGDSRSVYCKGVVVVALSEDHKPDNPHERARIERAGGYVAQARVGMGPWRVDGDLAVSRCLGDFEYKQNRRLPAVEQKVSALPECRIFQRDPRRDELLILACDGIWDVMTNQECCDALRELLMEGERDMGLVAEECIMMCLDKESTDNMSAVVIAFPAAKYGEGPGVAARVAARQEQQQRTQESQYEVAVDDYRKGDYRRVPSIGNIADASYDGGSLLGLFRDVKRLKAGLCVCIVNSTTCCGMSCMMAPFAELLLQRACERSGLVFPSSECDNDRMAQAEAARRLAYMLHSICLFALAFS